MYKNDLWLSYFWNYLPFVRNRFHGHSVTRIPFGIFLVLGRNVEQDETTLPFLLLALSPFVLFDSDHALILCLLCKSLTLWNIFMILGKIVEQDETMLRTRMQLWLSYFWSYLPVFCF